MISLFVAVANVGKRWENLSTLNLNIMDRNLFFGYEMCRSNEAQINKTEQFRMNGADLPDES
ncbi:Uncharacterized protein BM_BM1266 [Brugia malayi]|uniref:Bm1266 n=1 Tax=Brugia malayi TaxID=6279 RepID=A0A0J9XSC7_BRUMA|nr:Uncharacterized protein BM_BM1266 [Brugia malayi]CDP94643.1 Bm1266 [Brugia malayi]VIO86824.1 Uncharacterized protein BM_BM1266 [Brugia malayi]